MKKEKLKSKTVRSVLKIVGCNKSWVEDLPGCFGTYEKCSWTSCYDNLNYNNTDWIGLNQMCRLCKLQTTGETNNE